MAANAEESASAAEELSAQAGEMQSLVAQFDLGSVSRVSTRSGDTDRGSGRHRSTMAAIKGKGSGDGHRAGGSHQPAGSAVRRSEGAGIARSRIPFDLDDDSILKRF